MPVQLNHTIVLARDKQKSAAFLAELLGLPDPQPFGPFMAVQTANDVTLDYMDSTEILPQHYAFLVGEEEFDEIFGRIRKRGMSYWADPAHSQAGEINTYSRGRGLYFDDPDGHNMEILARA